jgi:hypothetical protein
MKPFRFLLAVLSFLLPILTFPGAHAVAKPQDRQAIILFISGLSFADLEQLKNYPHVDKWLGRGALGAMSLRTAGARTEANGYLLLGSGGQAIYTEASGTSYQAGELTETGETATGQMRRLSGFFAGFTENAILFPGIYSLHAENENKPFTAQIGRLGGILARHGKIAAAFGNSDDLEKKRRHAALFVVDEKGRIPAGDLSSRVYRQAPEYPDGHQTDYAYLLARIRQEQRSGVITVELSDLARLYKAQQHMAPAFFQQQYSRILADIDAFLGQLLQQRGEHQLIMVTSAMVNENASREK